MDVFIGSGRLTRNAVVSGEENKVVKFTVACKYAYDAKNKKDLVEFVPCVAFNISEKLQELLFNEGKGLFIEFRGRVSTSSFEKEGVTVYATDIIVEPSSIEIIKS